MQLNNLSFDEVINLPTTEIMNSSFKCSCGKIHEIPIKKLVIGKEIVKEVKTVLDSIDIKGDAGIIYDRKIENKVVNSAVAVLNESGIKSLEYTFEKDSGLVLPEIENSKKAADFFRGKVNYLIAIGSGVISDITKYAGDLLGIPVILIATAPSMNGYTSILAAMTEGGIKKTLPVKTLTAIFADINILAKSPVEMVLSGYGDILSKATSVADWKLSQIVKKTYFCPTTFHITDKTETLYMEAAEEIGEKSEKGIEILTDSIMRSGLSMTIVKNSTPSSGTEHAISHYWDLLNLMNKKEKNFHGTQVGIATPMAIRLFDFTSEYPVKKKVSLEKLKNTYMEREELKRFLLRKYKNYGKGLYDQVEKKYLEWHDKKSEIEYVIDNWDSIWNSVYEYVRPVSKIEDVLLRSGAPVKYTDIGLERDEVIDSIVNGWVLRSRYTILDTMHDLGISLEAAEKIVPNL